MLNLISYFILFSVSITFQVNSSFSFLFLLSDFLNSVFLLSVQEGFTKQTAGPCTCIITVTYKSTMSNFRASSQMTKFFKTPLILNQRVPLFTFIIMSQISPAFCFASIYCVNFPLIQIAPSYRLSQNECSQFQSGWSS